jgi:acyl dehydratase
MFKVETSEPPARCFEDFPEGAEMPIATKGPMTAGHQVRWAGACDNYASEFHHSASAAKEVGLPGLLLSGPFMACFMLTEITHWLGRDARVLSFRDRNSGSTQPGDLAHIKARVKSARVEGGRGLLDIDCEIVNQDGKVTTPGGLSAELPLRTAQGSRA